MTSSGGYWRSYLCRAKKILDAARTLRLYQEDTAALMDWIYYHEVLSEFSLRHWTEAESISKFCRRPLAVRPNTIIIGNTTVSSTHQRANSQLMSGVGITENDLSDRGLGSAS